VQEEGSTVVLPPREEQEPAVASPETEPIDPGTTPSDGTVTSPQPPPPPPAGEPDPAQTPVPPPAP
jgi:hypothetical protein